MKHLVIYSPSPVPAVYSVFKVLVGWMWGWFRVKLHSSLDFYNHPLWPVIHSGILGPLVFRVSSELIYNSAQKTWYFPFSSPVTLMRRGPAYSLQFTPVMSLQSLSLGTCVLFFAQKTLNLQIIDLGLEIGKDNINFFCSGSSQTSLH